MRKFFEIIVVLILFAAIPTYAATVLLTNSSDSLTTFRTNVNTSLTNLNGGLFSATSTSPMMAKYYVATSTIASVFTYASTTAVTATTFFGALTGNASTATALAANGTNCSAGNYPLGVDASGNSENCTLAASGGVGTSTEPFMAKYFVATSTLVASQFPQASSTQLTCTTCWATNFAVNTAFNSNQSIAVLGGGSDNSSGIFATGGSGGIGQRAITATGNGSTGNAIVASNGGSGTTVSISNSSTGVALAVTAGPTSLLVASTTMLSSYGPAYFGGSATSSFSTAGVLTLASPLGITSGGTNASSFTQSGGILAYDGTREVNFANYTLTSSLLTATNASTTNFSVNGNEVSGERYPVWSYATSTAWAASSTIALITPFAGILKDIQCATDVGTLNVQMTVNSTNVTPMFNASTTKGAVTFSGSNTFVRGDTLNMTAGTPATAPTKIYCTGRATGF